MSLCSNNLRALSRSRLPKTLAPFLYQTAMIQQWRSAVQPIGCRTASSRSSPEDDIPFEDEFLSPSIDETKPNRKITITGSERAAFEKLYKKFNAPPKPSRAYPEHEIDQIVDKYYEEDEENDTSAGSLDSIFDAVLSGSPKRSGSRMSKGRKKKADDLATLAEDILRPQMDKQRNKSKKDAQAKAARIKKIQNDERKRVRGLLGNAITDRELWQVLEKEVFGAMMRMDLDGSKKQQSRTTVPGEKDKGLQKEETREAPRFPTSPIEAVYKPPENDPARQDPRVLFPNFPHHLIVAAETLRVNFPSSPLPLSIIPTLKSLGRSSYALGATTSLYKILLRIAWIQQHSYTQICSLLQDMDNGGIECDMGVVGLLDEIVAEYRMARSGRLGRGMQVVLGMEQFEDGVRRLRAWRDILAKRLGAWSERRMDQGELVRKVKPGTQSTGKREGAVRGPKDELLVRDAASNAVDIAAPHEDIPFVEAGEDTATIESIPGPETVSEEIFDQNSRASESTQDT